MRQSQLVVIPRSHAVRDQPHADSFAHGLLDHRLGSLGVGAGIALEQADSHPVHGSRIVDDPAAVHRVGVSLFERYTGPYTEAAEPVIEQTMSKRICVRLVAHRVRTWDHHKLGLPHSPPAGSTAPAPMGRAE